MSRYQKNTVPAGNQDDYRSTDLLDALQKKTDIGHYGRLVFAMVARHFMSEDEIVSLLKNQPDVDEAKARAMFLQVQNKGYNPPKRDRILQWQKEQDFPICPNPEDPNACNVYRELRFPDDIYQNIGEFWEEKAENEG